MRKILIGFPEGTTPLRFPQVFTGLNSAYISAEWEPIYWCVRERPMGSSLSYIETPVSLCPGPGPREAVLDAETERKWIVRAMTRRHIGRREALNLVRSLAFNSRQIFKILDPAAFIGWNTLELRFGIAGDVASRMGIPTYGIESGILPGSWRIDRLNFAHVRADGVEGTLEDEQLGEQLLELIHPADTSLYRQSQHPQLKETLESAAAESRRVVLVLGTYECDTGLTAGSAEKEILLPGFRDSFDIAEELAKDSGNYVIFKPHPLWGTRFMGSERYAPAVHTTYSDPLALIGAADCVVSPFGKLEATTILMGKPLVRTGPGFFNGAPISQRCDHREGLIEAVALAMANHKPAANRKALCRALGRLHQSEWLLLPGVREKIPDGVLTAEKWARGIEASAKTVTTGSGEYSLEEVLRNLNASMLWELDARVRSRPLDVKLRKFCLKLSRKINFSLRMARSIIFRTRGKRVVKNTRSIDKIADKPGS